MRKCLLSTHRRVRSCLVRLSPRSTTRPSHKRSEIDIIHPPLDVEFLNSVSSFIWNFSERWPKWDVSQPCRLAQLAENQVSRVITDISTIAYTTRPSSSWVAQIQDFFKLTLRRPAETVLPNTVAVVHALCLLLVALQASVTLADYYLDRTAELTRVVEEEKRIARLFFTQTQSTEELLTSILTQVSVQREQQAFEFERTGFEIFWRSPNPKHALEAIEESFNKAIFQGEKFDECYHYITKPLKTLQKFFVARMFEPTYTLQLSGEQAKHSTEFHSLLCFGGWRTVSTKIPTTYSCSEPARLTKTYYPPGKNEGELSFTDHLATYHASWDIPQGLEIDVEANELHRSVRVAYVQLHQRLASYSGFLSYIPPGWEKYQPRKKGLRV
jgi:hypothetical protein